MYHTKVRNKQTLVVFRGTGQFKILSTLDMFTSIPRAEMYGPGNPFQGGRSGISWGCNTASLYRVPLGPCVCVWCAVWYFLTRWLYRPDICDKSCPVILIGQLSCTIDVLVVQRPMGIASHSYSPNEVVTAVKCASLGCMCIWKKEFVMLSLLQILPLAQSTSMLSTQGRVCASSMVFVFSIL